MDNARILLAEDNITNQKVAIAILSKIGCRVDPVGNGREAIDALALIDYDLVFMDVQMPEMSGLEATTLIRGGTTNVADPHVPIVAMTAGAMASDQEECLAAGMDGYIAKPVKPDDLRRVAAEFVARGREDAGVNGWMKLNVLTDMVGDDADLRRDILESFTGDIRQHSATISAALKASDLEVIARAAHALKSASGSVGAVGLQEAAHSVETGAKTGELDSTLITALTEASAGTDVAVQVLLSEVN